MDLPTSIKDLSEYAALPIVDAKAIEKDVRQIFSFGEHLADIPIDMTTPHNLAADVVITKADLDAADAIDAEELKLSIPDDAAIPREKLLRIVPARFRDGNYIVAY